MRVVKLNPELPQDRFYWWVGDIEVCSGCSSSVELEKTDNSVKSIFSTMNYNITEPTYGLEFTCVVCGLQQTVSRTPANWARYRKTLERKKQ